MQTIVAKKYLRNLTCFSIVLSSITLFAANYTVTTTTDNGDNTTPTAGSLRQALLNANANTGPNSITFTVGGTFTIPGPLPPIRGNLTSIDINGNNVTLSSATASGLFAFPSASCSLIDSLNTGSLTLSTASIGGNGGSGGGGALGAGGGIFVGSNASIQLTQVSFSGCKAQGGNGGSGVSGGGGGMNGGTGGDGASTGAGGGGGFGAAGGSVGSGGSPAGCGGGGGLLFAGGNGGPFTTDRGGGGGGGGDAGAGVSSSNSVGGNGGAGTTGTPGTGGSGTSGTSGSGNSGGGGGGGSFGSGGNAGAGLGGEGGLGGPGGGGGVGGGGLGGIGNIGGTGGFSGGGGGLSESLNGFRTGGNGGFGGGGASGHNASLQTGGGVGGFGGGGGVGDTFNGGSIFGGGQASAGTGGGGAAFGGAIFVANGATLTLSGAVNIAASPNTIVAGTVGSSLARGQDIFLVSSGTINFNHTNTVTIGTAIESNNGFGGVGNTTTGGIIMSGSGILDLTGNTGAVLPFTGSTAFNAGTTKVSSDANLGRSSNTMSFNGGTLEFTTAFTTSRTITLTGSGTVNTNAVNPTFSGNIGGSGGLTKTGAGILTLSGASNTFSGGLTINAGTLALGSTSINAAGSVNVNASGAAFDISGAGGNVTIGSLSGVSGGLVHLGARTLTFGTSSSTSFLGNIDGTGGLSKQGSGTVTLSGTNTYSGGTQLMQGTLAVGSNSALGTGTLTFNTNNGNILQAGAVGLSFSNAISLLANGVVDTNGQALTLSGAISNSGSLTKTGSGTLTLSGTNSYSGGSIINAGTLALASTSSISATGSVNVNASGAAFDISGAGGNITIGDLSGTSGSLIHLGARTLTFGTGNSTSFLGNIDGTGGVIKQGSGSVTLSGTSSYNGGTQLSEGTLSVGNNSVLGTGTLTFNTNNGNILQAAAAGLTLSNAISLSTNATVDTNGQSLTLSGAISNTGSLTKVGSGTLTLSGANSYSGGTIINAGAVALGSTSINAAGSVNANASGTTFDISGAGGNITIGDLSGALGSVLQLGARTLTFGTGNSTSFLGNIDGTGGITKQGSGTVTLSGSNSYSGGTELNLGTIAIETGTALGTGTLTFGNVDGNILQTAASMTLSNSIGLAKNGVIDTTNQILMMGGPITGPGGLNKMGSGQIILTGIHSYVGPTTVSAGTLTINGSITSPTTVLPSAALNGNGTITGDVVIGGLLGPGEEIGTIEIVGNVTFQSGSTFQVEADPTKADLLDVDASGNITIQPAATLEIVPTPGSYGTNTTYNIAYAGESGGIIIGTFDNIVNTYPLITAQVFYGTAASVSLTDTAAGINQMSLVLNFAPISSVVTTGNAGSIASSLDGVTPALDSDLYLVLQQLYFLPTDQALEDALNQMQPSILNTISLAQQNSSLFVSTAVAKHTADLRESNSPCTETGDKKWQIWGDGSIDWARQRGNHQNVGFHSQAELGAGGIDYRISRQFYVGVLGAYTHTSIHCHDHLAKGRVNTYYTGLYSSWLNSRFFANASVMGSFSDYHSKRKVQFGSINRQPKGHHHGSGVIAHLDLGASLPKESRVQCYPYGALDYVYQHEKGYTETKAQSLDVNIRSRNLNMLRSELGLQGRLCRSFKRNVFIPSGRLGWVYEKRFQGKKMNARLVDVPNRFTVNGLYPNRSMLAAGAAVTVVFNEIAHLSIAYEGLFGSGYISNAGNILLNIQF